MTSNSRTAGCGPACPVVWQGRLPLRGTPYADPCGVCPATDSSRCGAGLRFAANRVYDFLLTLNCVTYGRLVTSSVHTDLLELARLITMFWNGWSSHPGICKTLALYFFKNEI